jgi:hypothetical protein
MRTGERHGPVVGLSIEKARQQPPLGTTPFHEWVLPDGTPWTQFHRVQSGYLLRFPGLADFMISDVELAVSCCPLPDVDEHTIRHLHLNQVLPLVLSRTDKLVFHGSAIEAGERAIAFMGESGRGKSTLAASFAVNGHRVLADDGVVIEERERAFEVQPSHPSIRLWDDSQSAVLHQHAVPEPALVYTSKSRFLADGVVRFCSDARGLRRIYVLGDDVPGPAAITALTPRDALIELVKHSFLLDVHVTELLATHFDRLSRMVRQPVCFRLDYPRRFDALPGVRAAILRHCDS